MNSICTNHRSLLIIKNIANSMFININGPPISIWNPENYVKSWLVKHKYAKQIKSEIAKNNIYTTEGKECLWQIL